MLNFGKRQFEELELKVIGPVMEVSVKISQKTDIDKINSTKNGKQSKVLNIFINSGRKKQKEECNYHLMKCIVCCSIPPTIVDSNEWKAMMTALSHYYQLPSSTTLTEKLSMKQPRLPQQSINFCLHAET